jgi:hypothetical protein
MVELMIASVGAYMHVRMDSTVIAYCTILSQHTVSMHIYVLQQQRAKLKYTALSYSAVISALFRVSDYSRVLQVRAMYHIKKHCILLCELYIYV